MRKQKRLNSHQIALIKGISLRQLEKTDKELLKEKGWGKNKK